MSNPWSLQEIITLLGVWLCLVILLGALIHGSARAMLPPGPEDEE